MTIRITVDVFSGRPNPSVELGEDESAEVGDYLIGPEGPLRRAGLDEAVLERLPPSRRPDPPSKIFPGYTVSRSELTWYGTEP